MEAKAAGNPEAIAPRRGSIRERLAAFLPRTKPATNGSVAARVSASDPRVRLDRYLQGTDAVALHSLELPGGSELDSVIVGPAGITVVDSRHYDSKRATVSHGGLRIGRRDRSDLIYDVLGQVAELRDLLADTRYAGIPVEAALVLSDVEGVPVIESFKAPRILIWGTRWVALQASRPGPLSPRRIDTLASFLTKSTGGIS